MSRQEKRPVTEMDFRMPEFKDHRIEPQDYEFRDDGKIVRKDRWMTGFMSVANALGCGGRQGFEIDDVVEKVRSLSELDSRWIGRGDFSDDHYLDWVREFGKQPRVDLKLGDGSVVMGAVMRDKLSFVWNDCKLGEDVVAVRVSRP